MIAILIPVLDRPQNAQPLIDSIHAATKVAHVCIFIATRGDRAEINACKKTGAVVELTNEVSYAAKINHGVRSQFAEKASFFFLAADDLRFHPMWAENAVTAGADAGKPVIGTNDLGNPSVIAGRHATHSLVHRSYLEQGTIDDPTKLLHDGYMHNWVDTEFVETAISRDAFCFAFDSHVEHLHPFWGKGTDDVIYEKGREGYHHDRRHFQRRRKLWQRRGRG